MKNNSVIFNCKTFCLFIHSFLDFFLFEFDKMIIKKSLNDTELGYFLEPKRFF